ncbi:MAG: DUF2779 domain-containing protein [Gemmatimonadota bacterium]|nr:DUF2779 domain-containing protein [Gemmatimonadota bacterium]
MTTSPVSPAAASLATDPISAPSLAWPQRTLSKSDFRLARGCDAKLFFRENGYPDSRDSNPYLALLAEGGYMVEALAKAKYVDGVQIEYGRGVADDYQRTIDQLDRDQVTLFEATLLVGRQQARVDILEKKGNTVRLLEVKSKSFDGTEHASLLAAGKGGCMRSSKKPYGILSKWSEKLEDIAFQVLLLEKVLPGVIIKPFLVLVDTSKVALLDNIPGLFELVSRTSPDGAVRLLTARYIGTREQLADLDLVTEVDVSAEVAMLRNDVEDAAALFESRLDAPLSVHSVGLERGSKCTQCEFRVGDGAAKDGFAECWGPLAAPRPHMLELFSIGTCKALDKSYLVDWMVRQQKASLFDIPEDCLVKSDGTIGTNAERQRRQIEFTRRGDVFLSTDLRGKIEALQGPLNFIDFETSRLALPYHKGMRSYGLVTFQWSCHTVASHGQKPVHAEWLNNKEAWPNRSFAESLRETIGDSGPVLTWSHFEATTLKQIIADLDRFGHVVPELVEWMTDVFENRIVDMHEWARRDYYHPGMRGRTSIKVVLDALWKSDAAMRTQFEAWTGMVADDSRDPYASLPPVEISGVMQDVHEGTGAMRAYQEMMYGANKNDPAVADMWSGLLKRYCELDTLSMVLILEHWRRCVGLA